MATIINPITTVLINRKEFESKEFERYPFKYILEDNGSITYYSELTVGRSVFIEEASISGMATDKKSKAPEARIQPLAHGKSIPGEMFYMIEQFFLDVMDKGPSSYEAQAFVLWNEGTQAYRIYIPEQSVSAASVRYDIKEDLGPQDHIIMDIHSHNNMSAFFSGTDDNDDRTNPWISGVFGKITTELEYKFRFNDGCGRHFSMEAEDVFDFSPRFQTPKEWLDKVKINSAVVSYGKFTLEDSKNKVRPGDWTSPNQGEMDLYDEAFSFKASDVQEDIGECLVGLSVDESKKVLEKVKHHINTGEFANDDMDDSCISAYTDVVDIIINSEDLPAAISAMHDVYNKL